MHFYKLHAHETHAREMHAHEMHAHEVHTHGTYAYETQAYEVPAYEMHVPEVYHVIKTFLTLQTPCASIFTFVLPSNMMVPELLLISWFCTLSINNLPT